MNERDITLRDGRTLHVYESGDLGGEVVFVHHGTPGSGRPYPPDVEKARAQGVRLVSYDRAGYGTSSPRPGRDVAAVAEDIAGVADALGVERFASVGGSGGGPHTLAVGALLGDRCVATCAVASPAPWQAEGLDWLDGQGEQNKQEWAAALAGPEALERHLEQDKAEMAAAGAEHLRDALATLLPPVDREVLTGERAQHAYDSTLYALSRSVAGWRDDDLAFTRPWGFEFSDLALPVLLWQGVQDLMVPVSHGRWLAERLPGVEAHISEEDGHLSIAERRLEEILAWLRARF